LPGSFTGTSLESVLQEAGVDTVAITGYMTHMCVDTTSRQAAHRGLAVEILNDATGTLPLENSGGSAGGEELHRATLVAQGQVFADVVSTDDWLGRLRDLREPDLSRARARERALSGTLPWNNR